MRSTSASTRNARAEMSSRLPIGVATTYSVPARSGRSAIMAIAGGDVAVLNFQPVRAARCGLLIVAVFIAACATGPGAGPGGSTVKRAEQAWAAGDYATAAAEYLAAANRGNAPDRAYLRLRAAESHRQAGNVQGVRE